jgi:hypothetical protein
MSRSDNPDDRQQRELYSAEDQVNWSVYGGCEMLHDLKDVWTFANNLFNRSSFQRRYDRTASRLAQAKKMQPEHFSVQYLHRKRGGGIAGASEGLYSQRPAGLHIYPHNHGGWGSRDAIGLDRWARQKRIIIHELAHVVDQNENGSSGHVTHQDHGWQFAAIHIRLTQMGLGTDAAKALRASYQKNNILHTRAQGQRRYPATARKEWRV